MLWTQGLSRLSIVVADSLIRHYEYRGAIPWVAIEDDDPKVQLGMARKAHVLH